MSNLVVVKSVIFATVKRYNMKKIITLGVVLVAMAACKKNDTAPTAPEAETTTDTIAKTDTVAMTVKEVKEFVTEGDVAQTQQVNGYTVFGQKFTPKNVLTSDQMIKKYKSLKKGDTVVVQFKSKVKEVCKKKGCWMSMILPGEKESFVRFKDYGFFVPKNGDGSEAIVHGKAYLDVVSVSELKHYAKDGGKSQAEIDKITQPKITYAFLADGVLMK